MPCNLAACYAIFYLWLVGDELAAESMLFDAESAAGLDVLLLIVLQFDDLSRNAGLC
ncbi:hypothetical protein U1Q18_005550, partial [Sarracenia purpurea var. burkii]